MDVTPGRSGLLASRWAVGINELLISRPGCFSTQHFAVTPP